MTSYRRGEAINEKMNVKLHHRILLEERHASGEEGDSFNYVEVFYFRYAVAEWKEKLGNCF